MFMHKEVSVHKTPFA